MKSLLVTALALAITPSGVTAQAFEGTAIAIDGDTLDMTGMRIRLLYIDAPEAKQTCTVDGREWTCGSDATSALASLVDGQKVSCVSSSRDTYGRYLATCRTRLLDLSEQMLALGLSVASGEACQDPLCLARQLLTECGHLSHSLQYCLDDLIVQDIEAELVKLALETSHVPRLEAKRGSEFNMASHCSQFSFDRLIRAIEPASKQGGSAT